MIIKNTRSHIMNNTSLKDFLKKEVSKVLQEKVKKGKMGRGGIKKKIKDMKSLAASKPQELMKKLGIKGAPGGASEHDKVMNLVRSAIFGNEVMSAAFGGAKIVTTKIKEKEQKVVHVTTRKVSERDGAMYILHTLTGAHNAGLLSGLKSELEVSVEGGMITVVFSNE